VEIKGNNVSIITLTTDFGTQDGYVGAMKGRILSLCPNARIVDITHDIEPQNILQAAWSLIRSTPHFPGDSIHVAVIDPGVGSVRRPVMLKANDQWYIGPDNGIFSEIFRRFGSQSIYEIYRKTEWWEAHTSFDGLVLFAPTAACFANGISLNKLGTPIENLNIAPQINPQVEKESIKGQIVMFDRFGNAITNIHQTHLESLPPKEYKIHCHQFTLDLVTHYEEADTAGCAIINSDQLLELSVFHGSAKDNLELKVGDTVTIQ